MAQNTDDTKALVDEELERTLIMDEMAVVYRDLRLAREAGEQDRVETLQARLDSLEQRKRSL